MRELLTLLLITVTFHVANSLSCPPCELSGPCQAPQCCASGYLTSDICGCCKTCANGKNDACGGPFNSGGFCGRNLQCFKSCDQPAAFCNAENGQQCIFPFRFKGIDYNTCTLADSENGKTWCALAVDKSNNNEVVTGRWADCVADPGAFFNVIGKCVDNAFVRSLPHAAPGSRAPPPGFILEDGDNEATALPHCPAKSRCRCQPGGCNRGRGGTFNVPEGDPTIYGWCFLENVHDPSNPAGNCFKDTTYNPDKARFYSNLACQPSANTKRPVPVSTITSFSPVPVPQPPRSPSVPRPTQEGQEERGGKQLFQDTQSLLNG